MDARFAQEAYQHEVDQQDRLNNRAGRIITVLTTLGGALALSAISYRLGGVLVDTLFYGLAFFCFLSLLVSSGYLIWSNFAGTPTNVSGPKGWLDYWDGLVKEHKAAGGHGGLPSEEFNRTLMERYAGAADRYIDINFKRGERLVQSNKYMLAGFVLLVFTGSVYFYNSFLLNIARFPGVAAHMEILDSGLSCRSVPSPAMPRAGNETPPDRPVPTPGPMPKP